MIFHVNSLGGAYNNAYNNAYNRKKREICLLNHIISLVYQKPNCHTCTFINLEIFGNSR